MKTCYPFWLSSLSVKAIPGIPNPLSLFIVQEAQIRSRLSRPQRYDSKHLCLIPIKPF